MTYSVGSIINTGIKNATLARLNFLKLTSAKV